jgi:septum site-determining protein MinC
MAANLKQSPDYTQALELKTDSFTFPVLQLFANDMDAVATQLALTVEQAPELFHNTPVIIDLHKLSKAQTAIDFPLLVGLMRGYQMIPVGVRGGNQLQNEMAEMMELAILAEEQDKPTQAPAKTIPAARPSASSATPASPPKQTSLLVSRPVRSGQRHYAAGGDLIVMGPVNSGAEIVADGNIHVYGTLRGRAHAGVKGNRQAGIFCHDLQAELISIAGRYRINVDLDSGLSGKPMHIFLQDKTLVLEEI